MARRKVTRLAEVKPPVNEDIVEILKGVLAIARKGELVGIGITGLYRGGGTHTAWCVGEGGDSKDLFFGIERLKLRVLLGESA